MKGFPPFVSSKTKRALRNGEGRGVKAPPAQESSALIRPLPYLIQRLSFPSPELHCLGLRDTTQSESRRLQRAVLHPRGFARANVTEIG